MAATLMALIQTSLSQQQEQQPQKQQKQAGGMEMDFTVGGPFTFAPPAAVPVVGARTSGGTASLLLDLVKVVTEIARTDQMIDQTKCCAPTGAEAQKWHEISLRALGWSRDALVEQQEALLVQVKNLAQESATDVPETDKVCGVPTAMESPEVQATSEINPEGSEHLGSLRVNLEKVRLYDPARCILVRKIKQMGLTSPEKLLSYFSRFGNVTEVLVSHSFEKPSLKRHKGRVRPASLGFVIMESSVIAQVVLAGGEEHDVDSEDGCCTILAQAYEPASPLDEGDSPAAVSSSEPEPEVMQKDVFSGELLTQHEDWLAEEMQKRLTEQLEQQA